MTFPRRFPRFLSLWPNFAAFFAVVSLTQVTKAEPYVAWEPLEGKKLRIDGVLGDWPTGFAKLDQKIQGRAIEGEALLGYDTKNVFLAAKIADKKIARTARGGSAEDHLALELFVPNASGGGKVTRIDVFPGDPGKLPGLVQVNGQTISGAKAIEAADASGLELEAQIPWSALGDLTKSRVGLRGRFVYYNASSPGQLEGVTTTSTKSGQEWPSFPLESEAGLISTLLEPKGLSLRPAREVIGDVFGDSEPERVALYDHFLSITGPGYKDGKQFYFSELDVERPEQITRLSLLDFSGDGKSEIVLQKRLGTKSAYREVIQVLQLGSDGAPLQVFAHEIALVTAEGAIKNTVKLSGSGASARVTIAQGEAEGFEPDTFREPTIGGGIGSALLPWQSVGERSFSWRGQGLAQVEEKPFDPKRGKSAGKKKSPHPSGEQHKAPPPPRAPTSDELQDQLLALYKKDHGVTAKKPRFDFVTDVAEDDAMERVLVYNKDLVLFGKGFKKGLSYTFITIGVKDPSDILSVTSRDLTGDGHAELLVHAVVKTQAAKQLGGDVVDRQALFVYQVQGDELRRIFAAETARGIGKERVLGSLLFLPCENGLAIEVNRLRAIGFTEKTYPFAEESNPSGGLEPLLLPWGGVKPRRYEYKGTSFVLVNGG